MTGTGRDSCGFHAIGYRQRPLDSKFRGKRPQNITHDSLCSGEEAWRYRLFEHVLGFQWVPESGVWAAGLRIRDWEVTQGHTILGLAV
mmetsp:Transcript_38380/g.59895  ORF Transcript_38380/g.59895 Transcript_38380/m.59895 type:complete len:88 (+) Transcript_38380:230-493(+)